MTERFVLFVASLPSKRAASYETPRRMSRRPGDRRQETVCCNLLSMPKESKSYVVRVAAQPELAAIAELIAAHNARAETQCMHSDEVAATALARMLKAAERGDGFAVVALRGDELVGAAACEHEA